MPRRRDLYQPHEILAHSSSFAHSHSSSSNLVQGYRISSSSPSNNKDNMPPHKAPIDESADEAGTTHRENPHLKTIEEESMDETSATRHEPLLVEEDRDEEIQDVKEEATNGHDASSLRLHRKVAEIAAKTYRRASEKSSVLSHAKLADIALVKFEELEIGKFLGKGSFSNVHEITKITAGDGGDEGDDDCSWGGTDEEDGRPTLVAGNTEEKGARISVQVKDPRKLLTMHHQRAGSGTFRYAVKFLKEEIRSSPQKYAIGTADLVVEGMFLANLAHPNIIKVRGLPEGGVQSLYKGNRNLGYFLILDRLFDTLSERVYGDWKRDHRFTVKKKFGFLKSKNDKIARDKDLAVRLKVAFDISAAIKFLHSKRIIYRDLKPENLGFDVRGDIKLFDLGLVKELHPNDRDRGGNWKLSMAGTPRYMSPECGMYQPYNLSADVYSFSMLLWEILTVEKPLQDYTYSRLKNEIFIDGRRPSLKKVFNKKMRSLVSSGWSQNPKYRPSIDEVYDELKSVYLQLSPVKPAAATVSHTRRRSTYVAQRFSQMSVRHLVRTNTMEINRSNNRHNNSNTGPN